MRLKRVHSIVRRLAAALPAAMMLGACSADGNEVAWQYRAIDEAGWEAGDTLAFTLDSLPADGHYATQLMVRTTAADACPLTAVAIGVTRSWSGPEAPPPRTDTVWVELTTREGDVKGAGVSIYQYAVALDTLALPAGCRGTIVLEQLMRGPALTGLRDAGVRVVKL